MRRRLTVLLLACLGVLGPLAPAASAAANPEQAPCIARFTTSQPARDVGLSASSNAKEAHPLGLNVIRESAQLRPCTFVDD
jgi:hypothetical protein